MNTTLRSAICLLTLVWVASPLIFAEEDQIDIFEDLPDMGSVPGPSVSPAGVPLEPVRSPSVISPAILQPSLVDSTEYKEVRKEPLVAVEKPGFVPVDMDKTVTAAQIAYDDQNWDIAQKLFEAVLFVDPYHIEATAHLRSIAKRKAALETESYTTTRARMLEKVQSAWNTPKVKGAPAADAETSRESTEAELRITALREKLERLRIPAITFQDAQIQQVVLELSALLRKIDPEQKGINLVVFGTSETLLPPITFSGTDLSALETLDIITQISGLKYDIGPNRVSLTPVHYEPPQQMLSTEFDILTSVGQKMTQRAEREAGSLGLLDVREFFSTVPFPPGSTAQYNPEFNVLLVRHVPKHIDKVAALIEHYNQKVLEEHSRQIEIETKFIEIAEGAFEELGFEWTIGRGQSYINQDTWAFPGSQKLFTDTLRKGEDAFSTGIDTAGRPDSFNNYAASVADPPRDGLLATAGELVLQKIKGTPIEVLIRALEKQSGSDLLSAPKILTKSGETATIHIGEIHRFPTAYDLEIEREAQPVLIPLDYEEEKTGVMLKVTPELDPENGMIDMELSPEIRELVGFDEQHVATLWPFFNSGGTSANAFSITGTLTGADLGTLLGEQQGAADRLIARMPIFKTRKMETFVTIEDGSTIAMGGLIKEKLETFRDDVPILGKIPWIGRLFRSEGERSVKRNLLIFVTARQVDASGYKSGGK